MMWLDRVKELLKKDTINQQDYDEFVAIGKKLKSNEDILKYKLFGDGIYQLLDPDVKTDEF